MRRILGATACVLLLVVYLAPLAQSETVDSSLAHGTAWSVTVPPAVSSVGPESEACWPHIAPPDPNECDGDDSDQLVGDPNIVVGGTTASATLLASAAEAHEDADPTTSIGAEATLQLEMQAASGITLPTRWNARGYGRVEGFSALNGQIRAASVEAEAVAATRVDGTTIREVRASGASVVNLRLSGILADPVTGADIPLPFDPTIPNQTVFDDLGIKIVYWETNWNRTDGTTPSDAPVVAYALHITDTTTGADIFVSQADATADYTPNVPPVANPDTAGTAPDAPVKIEVMNNDSDGDDGDGLDPTSVELVVVAGELQYGTVECHNDGTCTYTPNPGVSDVTDTFTYRVCDNSGDCATAKVTVTIGSGDGGGSTNEPPNVVPDNRTTDFETPITIDVTANDTDPDGTIDPTSVTYTQPANGTVECDDNICTYRPNDGFSGTDTFTYRVCDNDGACDTATVTVNVGTADGSDPDPAVNNAPDARDDSATTQQGSSVVVDVTKNDSDTDGTIEDSTVDVTRQPTNGTVTCTLNLCTYEPNPSFSGTDTFDYTVCDNDDLCDTATVTITVEPVNSGGTGSGGGGGGTTPPTANDDTVTAQPGESVTIVVTDNDSDNADPSTVTVTDPPDNGTVECTNGACTYTPDDGFTGGDDFTYEVCNGTGQCDQATVVIVVPPTIPDTNPPVAEDDEATTRRGTPVPITVIQNDSDPDGDLDTSSVRVVQQPANGSVVCVGGTCTYTPNPGFTGDDSFVYEVCDATGNCDTATVTIVVQRPDSDGSGGPGGSIGEGGSSGGGNGGGGKDGGNGGPGGGSGRPNRDGQPSGPNDDAPAAPAAPPVTALNPILGAPKNPALPMTGGEPGFYLALAFNLVLAGGLLLFLDAKSRREEVWNVPAVLSGGTDVLDRTEAPVEIVLPATQPQPEVAREAEAELAPVIKQPEPDKQPARKPAATKKKAAPKKPAAKKPSAKKAATTKRPAAKKAASTKVSTTKKSTVAKKSTSTKVSTTKKSTVAKKSTSTKKSTVAKKKS